MATSEPASPKGKLNHLTRAKGDESAKNQQADASDPTRQDSQAIIENCAFLPLVAYLLLFFSNNKYPLGGTGKDILVAAKRLWRRKRTAMHTRNLDRSETR